MTSSYNNYPSKARHSQEERILALLKSRGASWTPAPELSQISLQYCRAIAGLRKRGCQIENLVETVNGVRHGFYRLATAPKLAPRSQVIPETPQSLFPDLQPESFTKWRDPEEAV